MIKTGTDKLKVNLSAVVANYQLINITGRHVVNYIVTFSPPFFTCKNLGEVNEIPVFVNLRK